MQCRVAIAVLLLLLLPLLMSKSNRCLFESAYHRMWKTIVELRLLLLLLQSIAVAASLFNITFVRLHFNIFLQLESRALEYTHRHRHNTQAQAYNHIETSHARDRKINRRRAKEITLNSLVFRFCLICTHFLYFSCASFLF